MLTTQDNIKDSHVKYCTIIVLAVLIGLAYFAWNYTSTKVSTVEVDEAVQTQEFVPLTFLDAETRMLEAAKKWQQNATLSKITSLGTTNEIGNTESWQAIFVSSSREGFGYVVQANANGIMKEEEIPYIAEGAPFPMNGKTQEKAIADVREMTGRKNAKITGVEAIYNNVDRAWYWGIKTDGGVVSVRID